MRRTMPAAVKIIGISSGMTFDGASTSPVKYCQLWFDGESVPKTAVAEYVIVPETHDRKLVLSSHTHTHTHTHIHTRFLFNWPISGVTSGWASIQK